jgi:ferredoxin
MKVKFMPSEEEHEIEFNETILHLAQRSGLHIQSVCKGLPSCAECRIQIVEGEHHVLPPSKKELDLIGTAHYVDRSRLSCQLRCFGDVIVDLSEQIEKEKRATQKPRDRMSRKDGKESSAILGGILDNVVAEGVEISEERADKVETVHVDAVKGAPQLDKRDTFYGSFYTGKEKPNNQNKNRNENSHQRNRKTNNNRNRNKPANPQVQMNQTQEASGTAPQAKKKKRNRNRNRNRNKAKEISPEPKS